MFQYCTSTSRDIAELDNKMSFLSPCDFRAHGMFRLRKENKVESSTELFSERTACTGVFSSSYSNVITSANLDKSLAALN